jgi:hypothetical protein
MIQVPLQAPCPPPGLRSVSARPPGIPPEQWLRLVDWSPEPESQRSRRLVRSCTPLTIGPSLAHATTLRRGVQLTENSISSHPVHRPLPPSRRSGSNGILVPDSARPKPRLDRTWLSSDRPPRRSCTGSGLYTGPPTIRPCAGRPNPRRSYPLRHSPSTTVEEAVVGS